MSDIIFCSAADRPRHRIYCILQYWSPYCTPKMISIPNQMYKEYTDFFCTIPCSIYLGSSWHKSENQKFTLKLSGRQDVG